MTIRLMASFIKMDFKSAQALAKKLEEKLQDLIDSGDGILPYITIDKRVSVTTDNIDMKPTTRLMTRNEIEADLSRGKSDPR